MAYTDDGILLSLKKGMLTYATACMDLEDIMLNDITQSQNDKYCDCTYMGYSESLKSETESRLVVARGWFRGMGSHCLQV